MALFKAKCLLKAPEKDLIFNLMKCAEKSPIFPPEEGKKIDAIANKLTSKRILINALTVPCGFIVPMPITGVEWFFCAGFISLLAHKLCKYRLFNAEYNALYYYAVQYEAEKHVDSFNISDKRKVTLAKMIEHAKENNYNFLAPGSQDNYIN